jgi:2-dehydro-3-deoxy-D-arabinonate dehydratase
VAADAGGAVANGVRYGLGTSVFGGEEQSSIGRVSGAGPPAGCTPHAGPSRSRRAAGAERPELFFKAAPGRSRGPGEPVGIRTDSGWDVPEPELAVVADCRGEIVAYTIANDMSSRSIEGENPLYLPQAKVYLGSCALGPALVPVAEAQAFENLQIRLVIVRDGHEAFAGTVPLTDMRRHPAELVDWLFRAPEFPAGQLSNPVEVVAPRWERA